MDDKQFDHIIKDKLESLSPPYKEEAWKAMDYRLDLLAPLPWYSQWKSLLVASSLGIITLLNIGLFYKVDSDQQQVKQLLRELKTTNTGPDTVYIATQNHLGTSFLSSRPDVLALKTKQGNSYLDFLDPLSIYKITSDARNKSGYGTEISENLKSQTASESNQKASESNQYTDDFSLTYAKPVSSVSALNPFELEYDLNAPGSEEMYVRGVVLPQKKTKWNHPIDPRIGVSIGYLIPDPDLGERFVTSRQSLLVETPIRGNFHLLSGLSFQGVTYKLDDVDDDNFERTTLLKYPDFGQYTTSPDEIRVENKMIQIPLYFRYYKPLNQNWSVFIGGGPTLDILYNQKFTYSFLEIRDEKLVKFNEIRESDAVKVTLGSFSGNMGVEHYFSSRLAAQMEINYQYGLGSIGIEGRSFNSFSVSGGLFYKFNAPRNR